MEKAFVSKTLLSQGILLILKTKTKKLSAWPLEMCRGSEAGTPVWILVCLLWGLWCREWECSVVLSQPSPQPPAGAAIKECPYFTPGVHPYLQPQPLPLHTEGTWVRTRRGSQNSCPTHPQQLTQFCDSAVMIKSHFSFNQSLTLVINSTSLCRVLLMEDFF